MYNLFPGIFIFLALGGIIILLKRKKLMREEDDLLISQELKLVSSWWCQFKNWFKKTLNKEKQRQALLFGFHFVVKTLTRLRIIILRIDKLISDSLKKTTERIYFLRKPEKPASVDLKKVFVGLNEFKEIIPEKEVIPEVDLLAEEKNLLKIITKNPEDIESLKNLARLYLWEKDLSSARWALLACYYLKQDDRVVKDLFIEIKEKETIYFAAKYPEDPVVGDEDAKEFT